jgi:hypothetical protein
MPFSLSISDKRFDEPFPLLPEVSVMNADQVVSVDNKKRNGNPLAYNCWT